MRGLHAARGDRAAARAHVLLEQRPEVLEQPLHRLGRAGRQGAERIGADGAVELLELVDVAARALAVLDPLEQRHPVRQPVAAWRAEAARLAREEALEVER